MNQPATTTAIQPLQVYESVPMDQIQKQVMSIQTVMRNLMHSGEHYGLIPGTGGKKPSLLQPGAQKLCLSFQLTPILHNEVHRDFANGHREYETVIRLMHRPTGQVVSDGVGVCSTLESRYRFRWDEKGPVPKEYWATRDRAIIGGESYAVRKSDKVWKVFQRIEHDNPADYYNTVRKMAAKRALVAATLNGLAASDIFTQDVEDMEDVLGGQGKREPQPNDTSETDTQTNTTQETQHSRQTVILEIMQILSALPETQRDAFVRESSGKDAWGLTDIPSLTITQLRALSRTLHAKAQKAAPKGSDRPAQAVTEEEVPF